eukprot:TRINITY_DN109448_c0_g1_i1.p1 TRINITY_DN109448_c0_g1~~TRINITY_DN109448_c0_g1_i1.p1  ORF type:complete len:275 (-),score=52.81 TRINITY_DN109448_c0_g1_i1:44-868(-)
MQRPRSQLKIFLAGAAAWAFVTLFRSEGQDAFVGPTSAGRQLLQVPRSEDFLGHTSVAMRSRKNNPAGPRRKEIAQPKMITPIDGAARSRLRWWRKERKQPVQTNVENVKEKQIRLQKEKNEKNADMQKKQRSKEQWPIVIEDGITLLHVEFDENDGNFVGKPSNADVMNFMAMVSSKFGKWVRVIPNYKKALLHLSPTKTYRDYAFEVVSLNSNKVLWSNLHFGVDLMRDKAYIDRFMKKLAVEVEANKPADAENYKQKRKREKAEAAQPQPA